MSDLVLTGLRKEYGLNTAVESIDLSVEKGEMIAFLGPSGCGKTTTLRMVAGFIEPTSGSIRMQGRDVTGLPPEKRDMGMVFQSYALFPHMSVRQNVRFGLKCRKIPTDETERRIDEALDMVGLSHLGDRYPRQMSGGQQQRVALARVLALRPALLLFDEPLSNLDAKLRVQMRHDIRSLQKAVGITSLFVTHDQEEAMTIADRIIIMHKGVIAQDGTPDAIYENPKTRFVADFIGSANLFEGAARDGHFLTAAGDALTVPDGSVPAGTAYMIRPEKIEILPRAAAAGEDASFATLAGTIERCVKLGGLVEFMVRNPRGDLVKVHRQDRERVEGLVEGAAVILRWRLSDVRLVD